MNYKFKRLFCEANHGALLHDVACIYLLSKKYMPVFHFHLMMFDMSVIFKMMFLSFLLVLIGNIFVEGKRYVLVGIRNFHTRSS
jgi:hypothetical protein